MGGHLARRGPHGRQRPARLKVKGLTHRQWEIQVHGLTDQFVMKGQALASLAQHPSPKGLLDVVDQRRARPIKDRGQVGQGKRRAEDRGDAKRLHRLHGEGLQLTEDQQPERGRKYELGELCSTLPNLDGPFAREAAQQFGHIQRIASGALDSSEERRTRR